jgi:hypothetical protein
MSDGYLRKREFYGDGSGSLSVTAFTTQTTLLTCRATDAIHLQRVHLHVNTGIAGLSWAIQDSAGMPVTTVSAAAPTADPAAAEYDFGPNGLTLTTGASLQFVPSAPGAIGAVTWDAFTQLTT